MVETKVSVDWFLVPFMGFSPKMKPKHSIFLLPFFLFYSHIYTFTFYYIKFIVYSTNTQFIYMKIGGQVPEQTLNFIGVLHNKLLSKYFM